MIEEVRCTGHSSEKKNLKLFGLNLNLVYGVEMKISNFQNFSMIAKSEIDQFVFFQC